MAIGCRSIGKMSDSLLEPKPVKVARQENPGVDRTPLHLILLKPQEASDNSDTLLECRNIQDLLPEESVNHNLLASFVLISAQKRKINSYVTILSNASILLLSLGFP